MSSGSLTSMRRNAVAKGAEISDLLNDNACYRRIGHQEEEHEIAGYAAIGDPALLRTLDRRLVIYERRVSNLMGIVRKIREFFENLLKSKRMPAWKRRGEPPPDVRIVGAREARRLMRAALVRGATVRHPLMV